MSKQNKKETDSLKLKSSNYQPSKEELEDDLSLPASFDEVMDALFASDRQLEKSDSDSGCKN